MSAREQTLNRLLDAATQCYRNRGITQTSLSDIIRESGVGRATVYRHFSNHKALLTYLLSRRAGKLAGELKLIINQPRPVADSLVETLLYLEGTISGDPVLLPFLARDPRLGEKLQLSAGEHQLLVTRLIQPLYLLARNQERLRSGVSQQDFIDWYQRILASLLTTPSPYRQEPDKMRAFLHNFLVPSLIKEA